MGGRRPARVEKRHLIRWNDTLDKKLLLCIQVACNHDGVKIPWEKVGYLMNDKNTGGPITEGAVVQHLAKLRTRMVSENLGVPPPLKRGGSTRITIGPNGNANNSATLAPSNTMTPPATPKKGAQSRLLPVQLAGSPGNEATAGNAAKGKKATKRLRNSKSDEQDDDCESEEFDSGDSDGEYGKPVTRRTKGPRFGKGKKKQVIKEEDCSDDEEKDEYQKTLKSVEKLRRTVADEHNNNDAEGSDDETISDAEDGFVGANASFLPVESPTVSSSVSDSDAEQTLMVTLDWGNAYHGNSNSHQIAQVRLQDTGVISEVEHKEASDDEEYYEAASTAEDKRGNAGVFDHSSTALSHGIDRLHSADANSSLWRIESNGLPLVPTFEQNHLIPQQTFEWANPQSYQPEGIVLQTNFAAPDQGYLNVGPFSEMVETPIQMNFSQAGAPIYNDPGANLNLHLPYAVSQDLTSTNNGVFDHGPVPLHGGAIGDGLSRHNSDGTTMTFSSSADGSLDTNFLTGTPTEPSYGVGSLSKDDGATSFPTVYDPAGADNSIDFNASSRWMALE